MLLNRLLPLARDQRNIRHPRRRRFFHDVLNRRPIQNRQQLLRHRLGRRQHARAEPGGGDDGLGDYFRIACHCNLTHTFITVGLS